MTVTAISVDVTLATINCGGCGGTYAINERYRKKKQQEGGSWTCPYCKVGWGYSNNSDNARLKAELERERRRREWAESRAKEEEAAAEHERRRANGYKGQLTKTKKRAAAGVCPCCTRHFTNLQRHMASKHPEYADS